MGDFGMDGSNVKKSKDEYLGDLGRARKFYETALSLLEIDLETTANRIYLSFENLAYGVLKWKHSQTSKKHAQIWEKMDKLHFQGILSFDPKLYMIESYRFHLFVDYGKKEFKEEVINFNKEKVRELLKILGKLLLEVEEIIGKK